MAIPSDHLLHSATIQRLTGSGSTDWGNASQAFADLYTGVKCRRVDQAVAEFYQGKQLEVASHKVLFDADVDVTEEDRVVIGGVTYQVTGVKTKNDGNGPHHLSVAVEEIR